MLGDRERGVRWPLWLLRAMLWCRTGPVLNWYGVDMPEARVLTETTLTANADQAALVHASLPQKIAEGFDKDTLEDVVH